MYAKNSGWRYQSKPIIPINLQEDTCKKVPNAIDVSLQLKKVNVNGVISNPVTKLQSSLEKECRFHYRWHAFKTGFRHSRDPKQALNPVCLFPCIKCQVAYVKGTRTFFWLKDVFNAL
jgi:hypothetical protein